ncbi:MAG TPA: hypothetical protein VFF88_10570 [Methylocella sp.]|nr:hypothetical protein [Methylocella sp.]
MSALFLLALILYLIPAAFGLSNAPRLRQRLQHGAVLTLAAALAVAALLSILWLMR